MLHYVCPTCANSNNFTDFHHISPISEIFANVNPFCQTLPIFTDSWRHMSIEADFFTVHLYQIETGFQGILLPIANFFDYANFFNFADFWPAFLFSSKYRFTSVSTSLSNFGNLCRFSHIFSIFNDFDDFCKF